MEISDKFCLDGIQGQCQRERNKGCGTCSMYQTYKECTQCGDDSSCTPIGDDNLCNNCKALMSGDL